MVQTRSNIPTTSHVVREENVPGNGNGKGEITSAPDTVQVLFGLGVTAEQLQGAVAALSAMGGSRPGTGATQAPHSPNTEHAATSQHKGKKIWRSRRRPGKAPVIEEVLVEDVPGRDDDESSECRVSAFKRLGARRFECQLSTGSTADQKAAQVTSADRYPRAGGGMPRSQQPRTHARRGLSAAKVDATSGLSVARVQREPRKVRILALGSVLRKRVDERRPYPDVLPG
ncbi:unnamed protein product [Cuscuta campestris]|uniref:Uncharacterized protein n=1 Tax=Cuscuta campestris TaxID=132261 RepID=A0A484MMX6_9ASTE|nr:unnamed protein product [Cuscuta campestris]